MKTRQGSAPRMTCCSFASISATLLFIDLQTEFLLTCYPSKFLPIDHHSPLFSFKALGIALPSCKSNFLFMWVCGQDPSTRISWQHFHLQTRIIVLGEHNLCPSCRIYTYCHHIATCLSFLCGGFVRATAVGTELWTPSACSSLHCLHMILHQCLGIKMQHCAREKRAENSWDAGQASAFILWA